MNIERLLKLLKLANHNPNDAEANSAARSACKMFSEDNYKWIESQKNGSSAKQSDRTTRRTDRDWWRPSGREDYWREWARQTEDRAREEKKAEEQYRRKTRTEREGTRDTTGWDDPGEDTGFNWAWDGEHSGTKGYRKVYKQVCRDCSVCGITRLTTDETIPYVCYQCKTKS